MDRIDLLVRSRIMNHLILKNFYLGTVHHLIQEHSIFQVGSQPNAVLERMALLWDMLQTLIRELLEIIMKIVLV